MRYPARLWVQLVLLGGTIAGAAAVLSPENPSGAVSAQSGTAMDSTRLPSSSAYLALLPESEAKRLFILDCTGCHVLDERIAFPKGKPRERADWQAAVARMLGYAGAHSAFPVISAEREAEPTATWLNQHMTRPPSALPPVPMLAGASFVEYPIPEGRDLPHDLAVDAGGRVVITGMLTNRMYTLDPETAEFATVPIPVQKANPRSLEIDADGNWWIFLGAPGKVARYAPDAQEWTTWDAGMYAHEVRVDARGRAWFNGHFSKEPEVLGYVDPRTGEVRTFRVPTHPAVQQTGPIPYGLRIAPDGKVWGTELRGNRIFRFDPNTEDFKTYWMPSPHSGPRRIAFGADGALWIPAYAANRLVKFSPDTERFAEYDLPTPDALPYVAEVDPRTGRVWLGTGAADALFEFDPITERFTTYPLPTRGALVRHITVDSLTGDIWAAYGASPGIPSKVARLRIATRP